MHCWNKETKEWRECIFSFSFKIMTQKQTTGRGVENQFTETADMLAQQLLPAMATPSNNL